MDSFKDIPPLVEGFAQVLTALLAVWGFFHVAIVRPLKRWLERVVQAPLVELGARITRLNRQVQQLKVDVERLEKGGPKP